MWFWNPLPVWRDPLAPAEPFLTWMKAAISYLYCNTKKPWPLPSTWSPYCVPWFFWPSPFWICWSTISYFCLQYEDRGSISRREFLRPLEPCPPIMSPAPWNSFEWGTKRTPQQAGLLLSLRQSQKQCQRQSQRQRKTWLTKLQIVGFTWIKEDSKKERPKKLHNYKRIFQT